MDVLDSEQMLNQNVISLSLLISLILWTEDDTEYLANNAAAELEYSDTESVKSSGSTALKAHAARMYESLSFKD